MTTFSLKTYQSDALDAIELFLRQAGTIGERWAQTTGQRFAMVEKTLNGMNMAAQIRAAIQA